MKIIIYGFGGQGVKFASISLGEILTKLNYKVSLTLNYDAAMSLGEIFSQIVFSKTEIENPLIEKADLLVLFSKTEKNFKAEKILDFSKLKISAEFEKSKNIVFLGKILKEIGLDSEKEKINWEEIFGRNFEENKKALEAGINL